jgi:hypothetical protein
MFNHIYRGDLFEARFTHPFSSYHQVNDDLLGKCMPTDYVYISVILL